MAGSRYILAKKLRDIEPSNVVFKKGIIGFLVFDDRKLDNAA
jgi:hypothetical protein